jgi:hypothetical protein
MAKSGKITAGVGTDAALKLAVANAEPRISTLGAVAFDSLKEFASKTLTFIDTKARKVIVADTVAAVQSAESNATVDMEATTFVPDVAGKASSPFTVQAGSLSGLNDEFIASVAPVKPSFSISSLVSKIEDTLASQGRDGIIVVDQVVGKVRVYDATPAEVAAANIAAGIPDLNTFAEFAQTDIAANGGPRDPFE